MTTISNVSEPPAAGGKLFLLVYGLALLGVVAIIPYSLVLTPLPEDLPVSPAVAIFGSISQGAILLAVASWLGLFFARRTGLGLPLAEAWLSGRSLPAGWPARLLLGAVLGLACGGLIIFLEQVVFDPQLKDLLTASGVVLPQAARPGLWRGALAALYGGISEEVLLRLWVLSMIAWLGARLDATAAGLPTRRVLWLATLLAAVLFGLGHLPTTAALGIPINGLVITRALVLNGIVGLVAGWLYFTRGLETAMAAHFAADIVLLVVFPLLAR